MLNTAPNDNIRFVTGVILANGVPDDQDDVFTKQDIKKMFIKYLQHDTDTMHNYIRNEGVDLVANWITEIDREINGKIAPVGSWMATFKVSNPELIKFLDDGTIGGYSLGSMPKELLTQKFWFLNKPIQDVHSFRDLPSIDDANPVFISFVKKGSNGYGLEIEKPNVYINKSSEDNKMPEQNTNIEEETITLSGLAKLKEIFGINKTATETAKPKQEVKPEQVKTEPVQTESNDISNNELLEKIPNAVATGITNAFTEMAKKEAENTAKPTKPVKTENGDEEEDDETKPTETNTSKTEPTKKIPKINKSATSKEENSPAHNVNPNFYSQSGRDMFGCRIRK